MRVEYVGAIFDGSGYAEAARNYVRALVKVGVDVLLRPINFDAKQPDFHDAAAMRALCKDGGGDLRLLHVTPDLYQQMLDGKPVIPTVGYVAWETDKLPAPWVAAINKWCHAMMVPSQHNVEVFQQSGVSCPVYCVPHCFPPTPDTDPKDSVLPPSTSFRFLSVFQWTERKNPIGLLKAYLTEFQATEHVSLVLKTYTKDSTPAERENLKTFVAEVKRMLFLPAFPAIELVVASLSDGQMSRLYHDCDAFVSLHRCEGFGIPIAQAMLAGKPVIATGYGGPADFVPADSRVPYTLTPVFGMPWPHYTGAMDWAEPDLEYARKLMRDEFESPSKGTARGALARASIVGHLNYETVGQQMKRILEQVISERAAA